MPLLALLIQQATTIDSSIVIAIITGIVAVFTMFIQTWSTVQLAKLRESDKAAVVVRQKQSEKIEEVHQVVNGGRSELLAEIKQVRAENKILSAAYEKRVIAEAAAAAFESGRLAAASELAATAAAAVAAEVDRVAEVASREAARIVAERDRKS